jgi:hypothetical protein
MRDLDRIERALATNRLSAQVFERCGQDLLSTVYQGLTPVPGGSDWGRDADIVGSANDVPARLLITSSRGLDGVRKNMLGGIKSMKEHGVPVQSIVLANPAILSRSDRGKLAESASRAGASLNVSEIFDGTFFASRLRRDGYWRRELLGLPSSAVTLSPVPAGLAESPWAFLPFAARDEDMAAVTGSGDLVLSGPPGTGKSRLLGELPGAAFVDKDASLDSIADDLRWVQPQLIVVDDAAGAEAVVNRLLWLRRAEADLFSFRLIAACWPPDADAISDLLPSAQVYELGLMEREPLDGLIQAMGISGQLARREILGQAEGRPGWAITLADLLLRKNDPHSVISGKALLGEVGRYLRRAGLANAIEVLAVVSALGWVSERELGKLSGELQMPRADAARLLNRAARSGLVDVRTGSLDGFRSYAVRPPMLADALVAEQAFSVPVPGLDLHGLADQWPGHAAELTGASITSAVHGALNARPVARELLDQVLGNTEIPPQVNASLSLEYVRLDRSAAEHVIGAARQALSQLAVGETGVPLDAEGIVEIAGRAAYLYQLDSAVDLLLDAAVAVGQPRHLRRGDPVREIERLVQEFHPEVPRQVAIRQQVARRTRSWLAQAPADPARLGVTAAVMQIVLSLRLRSAMSHPGRPDELHLIDTIAPADEIRHISGEIWPELEPLLGSQSPGLAAAAIDVAGEWLRVGAGYDHPFGQDHPQDRTRAAREAGEMLAQALAERDDLSVGLLARLRAAVKRFSVNVTVRLPPDLEVFFSDIETPGGGWLQAEQALVSAIRSAADARAGDDPDDVIALLTEVKAELAYLPRSWPNRPRIAAERLAEVAADPLPWLRTSIRRGFLPEGCAFAERLAREGKLPAADARTLLAQPESRDEIAEILLRSEPPATPVTGLAADALGTDDYLLLSKLIARRVVAPERLKALLTRPDPAFVGVATAAVFNGQHDRENWDPGELEPEWLSALGDLHPARIPNCSGHDMAELFKYLAARYPGTLTEIITRTLDEPGQDHPYASLPYECWDVIRELPGPSKLELWHHFQDRSGIRRLLRAQLLGSDTQWIAQLLDAKEVSPDEVLASYDGTQPDVPVEELARILVPRGIDPARIAALRFWGQYSGNLSSWYQSSIDSFTAMLQKDDPSVRSVATAGIELFTRQRDQAARNERLQRIRGYELAVHP